MLKVDFCNEKPSDAPFTYVVIAVRYNGKWVLVRHRERDTYEIPGGHIETGEDCLAAAKWELYEETGAKDFTLDFISIYTVTTDKKADGLSRGTGRLTRKNGQSARIDGKVTARF